MTALVARWRALPFAVRLASILAAVVGLLILVRHVCAAGLLPAGLLAPALISSSARRARSAASEASNASDDLDARARAADKRAAAKAARRAARDSAGAADLLDTLDRERADAERRARERLSG